MAKFTTSTLTTEIELITTPRDRKVLNTRFEKARIVYYAVLCERLGRLSLMQESKDYRVAQELSKGEEGIAAFKEVTKKHGLHGKYCLESWANQNYWARAGFCANYRLGSHVIQKLAIRAGKGIQHYSYHQIGRPRLKSCERGLHSVESENSG